MPKHHQRLKHILSPVYLLANPSHTVYREASCGAVGVVLVLWSVCGHKKLVAGFVGPEAEVQAMSAGVMLHTSVATDHSRTGLKFHALSAWDLCCACSVSGRSLAASNADA